jgi:hypothetical protein
MKQFLLILTLFVFSAACFGQRDSIAVPAVVNKGFALTGNEVNISIYPVPVRENFFTIRSDKEIAAVRITNIIGQETYIEKFGSPVFTTKITLDNPRRGMYLIAITFSDNTRCVRRLLVEGM